MTLRVSGNDRRFLEETVETVRHATGEARLYRRAQIILLACEGESVSGIARTVGTCCPRVLDGSTPSLAVMFVWTSSIDETDQTAGLS